MPAQHQHLNFLKQQKEELLYTVIDFITRNAGSTVRGFTFSGRNLYMKNLVIQNAWDNRIWVSGSKN